MPEDNNEGGVAVEATETGGDQEFSLLDAVDTFQETGEVNDQFPETPAETPAETTEVSSGSEDEPGGEAEGDTSAPDDAKEGDAEAGAEDGDGLSALDELDPRATTEEGEEQETTPTEYPDASEIKALEGDERAQAKWNELRGDLEVAQAEINTLKETQENSPVAQQLREMHEQLAESQRQLAAFDVETTAEYQQAVGQPLDAIMEAAKGIAERTDGIEADDLYTIMSMDGSPAQNQKMSEIAQSMDEADKFSFFRMVSDSTQLLAKDREIRENAAEAAVEIENSRAEAAKVAQAENMKKVRGELSPIFEKLKATIDSPDIDLGKIEERALADDLYGLEPDAQAFALASSALTVPLLKELKKSQIEVNKLKKEVKSLVGANPGVSPKNDSPDPKAGDDSISLFDKIDAELNKARM